MFSFGFELEFARKRLHWKENKYNTTQNEGSWFAQTNKLRLVGDNFVETKHNFEAEVVSNPILQPKDFPSFEDIALFYDQKYEGICTLENCKISDKGAFTKIRDKNIEDHPVNPQITVGFDDPAFFLVLLLFLTTSKREEYRLAQEKDLFNLDPSLNDIVKKGVVPAAKILSVPENNLTFLVEIIASLSLVPIPYKKLWMGNKAYLQFMHRYAVSEMCKEIKNLPKMGGKPFWNFLDKKVYNLKDGAFSDPKKNPYVNDKDIEEDRREKILKDYNAFYTSEKNNTLDFISSVKDPSVSKREDTVKFDLFSPPPFSGPNEPLARLSVFPPKEGSFFYVSEDKKPRYLFEIRSYGKWYKEITGQSSPQWGPAFYRDLHNTFKSLYLLHDSIVTKSIADRYDIITYRDII